LVRRVYLKHRTKISIGNITRHRIITNHQQTPVAFPLYVNTFLGAMRDTEKYIEEGLRLWELII
jgi:hypothetical protein